MRIRIRQSPVYIKKESSEEECTLIENKLIEAPPSRDYKRIESQEFGEQI